MNLFKRIALSGLLLFVFISGYSQNANIRGFVYYKENAEPVIFTNIFLKGTGYGASTDVNGYFSITKIPAGTYTLIATYVGCDTVREEITIKANDIISKKIYLPKSSIKLKTVEITGAKQDKQTQTKVSEITITPKEIKQLPSVGGEPDIAQYLQVLPGVIFTGDQGGQLYIRGGSPIQNKVLLDGMIIYNPFHSIGLFSVFETDIIRNADVYTGGFGAQYGGRVSSIMDITTKDGNKKRLSGKVAASPFGAKLLLEGPLKKQKEDGKGSSSFIVSAKNSYLPTTSKFLYSYVDSAGLPFGYTDLYGKISLNAGNGSKINFFGFNFKDDVNYQALSNLSWESKGMGSNFVLIPASSSVLIQGHFAFSNYGISLIEELKPETPRTSDIKGFNMGLDFTYFAGLSEINYGLEVLGFKTDFQFYNSVDRLISQSENTTEIGAYLKYKFMSKNKKILIEPSFRTQYYASLNNFSPEPRLAAKYNITDKIRVKLAGGIYSQNLISATSDRDVVNLFYGFLSGPDNLQTKFTEKDGSERDIKHKLQKANHAIFGMEFDLPYNLDLTVEAFNKNFTQLANINRDKIYEDNSDNNLKPDYQKKDFIIETAYARGADAVLKYDYKHLYLWAVYSLTYVKRWDGIREYAPHYDRRHNVNLVASYSFGKGNNWEVDARWNFGSGFPFTKTAGYYEKYDFSGGLNTDYTTTNGDLGVLYGDLNAGRLPAYHRLDVNIKRTFEFSEYAKLEVTAGATNAYSRENIFYFDRVQYKRVNQLPILPSLSANFTF